MAKYDVLIIGGGVAGITCALTLSSVENKFPWAKDRKYLIIDENNSDLLQAKLYNVPGVRQGALGEEVIRDMRKQLDMFKSIEILDDIVVRAEGSLNNFSVTTKSGKSFLADRLVLATGMHKFDIEGLNVEVLPHDKVMKPKKIKIKNKDLKVREGLYVAGLVAGSKTMFAIAAGDGAKVACDIFEEWTGKFAVAHDSVSKN